jgi:alpha-glucosidase
MPLDNRHDNEGEPTDHREIHNVYGMLMAKSTFEGLQKLRPNERPFVLSRASFAGGQRYSALWPGDNQSDWSHLRGSLTTLMGLGLSGFTFVGADIGGFAVGPSADLYTRWLQAAVFSPFMRTHAEFDAPEREPWSYGLKHETINKRAIELRYELLPHIYNGMKHASETGLPAMRPLFLNYPDDDKTYDQDDTFLYGDDILAAPVVREGALKRKVYLPKDEWYDFWTGEAHKGGQWIERKVTLESNPIFVRGGAFVFRQPSVQHTGEMKGLPLRVDVYPAAESKRTLYEDDGETLAYQKGAFFEREFSQKRDASSCVVSVGAAKGTYRPAPRDLVLKIKLDRRPTSVLVGTTAVPERVGAARRSVTPGWTWDAQGWVSVRLKDQAEALSVAIALADTTPKTEQASAR